MLRLAPRFDEVETEPPRLPFCSKGDELPPEVLREFPRNIHRRESSPFQPLEEFLPEFRKSIFILTTQSDIFRIGEDFPEFHNLPIVRVSVHFSFSSPRLGSHGKSSRVPKRNPPTETIIPLYGKRTTPDSEKNLSRRKKPQKNSPLFFLSRFPAIFSCRNSPDFGNRQPSHSPPPENRVPRNPRIVRELPPSHSAIHLHPDGNPIPCNLSPSPCGTPLRKPVELSPMLWSKMRREGIEGFSSTRSPACAPRSPVVRSDSSPVRRSVPSPGKFLPCRRGEEPATPADRSEGRIL